MPKLPTIDFPTIDLNAMKIGGVELPFKLPFDLPKFDIPTIDLSKVELPFELPKFELPNVDLPSAEQVIDFFRDAALAGTGLVSLTAERIADLQKALVEALKTQVEKVRSAA